jgi:hypothetical protein
MTMSKRRSFRYGYVVAIAVCVLCAVNSVRAADPRPFIGFDVGWARYPQNYETIVSSEAVAAPATVLTNSTLDQNRLGWSLSAGYRFNRYLNLEAGFVDLGSIAGPLTDSSGLTKANGQLRFSVKGETLAAVGLLPLGRWDLFLKGGIFFADAHLNITGQDTERSFSRAYSLQTQHGLIGFGVERHYAENWGVRFGLTDYLSVGSSQRIHGPNIKVLSAGLTYSF